MREIFRASTAALAEPLRGLRVLLYGFSGKGFPGGDGVAEAVESLPLLGLEAVYTHALDPLLPGKLSRSYDVAIICNTRIGALLAAPRRLWRCALIRALWFWDLRPGHTGAPLRGLVDHVFLSFSGSWAAPDGTVYAPSQWSDALGCQVGYCPQGSPLRTPMLRPDGPRVLFVGDVHNPTYHRGRADLCQALGAQVLNHRDRPGRLALEGRLPELYRSARYVLSMSPRAPGYTSVRTFSITACGGLLLLHRFPGAEEAFTDRENCVMFDSATEAVERLAELDNDVKERERIAAQGRRLHATRDTVAHRILSICRAVTGCAGSR